MDRTVKLLARNMVLRGYADVKAEPALPEIITLSAPKPEAFLLVSGASAEGFPLYMEQTSAAIENVRGMS